MGLFPAKGQRVSISGSVGHMSSAANIQLCNCSTKATMGNTYNGEECVSI